MDQISARTQISSSYIRHLISQYKEHGKSGLAIKRTRYFSQEFKLSILEEIENKYLSLNQASIKHDVGLSTIHLWLGQYKELGRRRFLRLKSIGLYGKQWRRPDMERKKKRSLIKNPKTPYERELEEKLEYARAENAYLKKLRALVQKKRQQESKSFKN